MDAGGDRRHALPDERRRVRHRAHDDRALRQRRFHRRRGDAGGDGQQTRHGRSGQTGEHLGRDLGLHRQHGIDTGDRRIANRQRGMRIAEDRPALRRRFDHMDFFCGRPTRGDHAAEQGFGHLAAADELELQTRHEAHRTGLVPAAEKTTLPRAVTPPPAGITLHEKI